MKNQKGITLIALVITIIVLLILAGITIAMLTGDNGLLTKSQTAVKDNAIGSVKDKLSLAQQAGMSDYLQKYYSETDVTKKAENKLSVVGTVKTELDKVLGTATAGKYTVDGCEVLYTAPDLSGTTPVDGSLLITYDTRKCEGTIKATAGTATSVGTYKIEWKAIENTSNS